MSTLRSENNRRDPSPCSGEMPRLRSERRYLPVFAVQKNLGAAGRRETVARSRVVRLGEHCLVRAVEVVTVRIRNGPEHKRIEILLGVEVHVAVNVLGRGCVGEYRFSDGAVFCFEVLSNHAR